MYRHRLRNGCEERGRGVVPPGGSKTGRLDVVPPGVRGSASWGRKDDPGGPAAIATTRGGGVPSS